MKPLNETGFAATAANFDSTPCNFIYEEKTSDPTSLFDVIRDSIIIQEADNLIDQSIIIVRIP